MNAAVNRHRPEDHTLVRGGSWREGYDRSKRPLQAYDCSCGEPLSGTSRRQARTPHRAHRKTVTT